MTFLHFISLHSSLSLSLSVMAIALPTPTPLHHFQRGKPQKEKKTKTKQDECSNDLTSFIYKQPRNVREEAGRGTRPASSVPVAKQKLGLELCRQNRARTFGFDSLFSFLSSSSSSYKTRMHV